MQLEAQQAEGHVNTADSNIVHCCSHAKLLEPAVVKSVHTCRCIISFFFFLSFSFCSTCKLFICFYSTTPTPSSPGFMRMKWAQLLSSTSFFLFFFFFCFSSIFFTKKKKTCYRFIDEVRVQVCAEADLKDSFFSFAPKLLSLGARLRPR